MLPDPRTCKIWIREEALLNFGLLGPFGEVPRFLEAPYWLI